MTTAQLVLLTGAAFAGGASIAASSERGRVFLALVAVMFAVGIPWAAAR